MDPISPATSAYVAPVAAVRAVASRALPDYAERMARFDLLATTVLDGKAGEEQRLAAYQDLQAMSASGQLIGAEDERRKLLDRATFDSDIGQRAQQLSSTFLRSVNEAGRSGGAAGALRAATSAFDGLSASDQKVLFATTLNAPDRLGARPYSDAPAWRANAEAQSRMVDYMQAAGVVGANGQLDYRAAAARSDDAKLSAAVKLSQRRDNTSPDWTRSVLQLFGAARAPDRLDLSPAARKLVDAAPAPAAAPQATPYRAGALVSRTA
ncbi:hypothetical protein [uncultured Phenylobacterium sp.]|uniref:hypothetical protein n=1 Tax=uncultured Phenylobacterium sp. TaxID=349273 RepID=UPI0025E2A4E9|nr:hypothetical protein [uncultured Phenylobacterium sp.]